MSKELNKAIKLLGTKSGISYFHSYMSGAMIPTGRDLNAYAEVLSLIFESDAKDILSRLEELEEKVFKATLQKQYDEIAART